jgi:hypothetical protein
MSYAEDPNYKVPPTRSKIWRYIDFTKLVSMLDKKSLYFTSLEVLAESDPFEGLLTRKMLEIEKVTFRDLPTAIRMGNPFYGDEKRFDEYKKASSPEVRTITKLLRAVTFVNSWHANDKESAAMWEVYLKSDEGVAIQSTVQRLINSFSDYGNDVCISQMKYLDYSTDFMARIDPLISKRNSFEYERELRAFIFNSELMFNDAVPPRGIYVPINLDELVDAIYVSPKSEKWFADLVGSVCVRYKLAKEVIQSDLASSALY